jgi:hypothetical protein
VVNQGSPDVEKSAQAVHEGEHGVLAAAHGNPQNAIGQYNDEKKAYETQSYMNQGLRSDSDRNLWTVKDGYNQNAVNENAEDSTRANYPTFRRPDEDQ